MNTELHTAPADIQAVIDTAQDAVQPVPLEVGRVYAVRDPHAGTRTINLTGDEYRESPSRKTGTTRVWDAASFLAHFEKHADEHSEVYADVQRLTVTAVLDAHTISRARWGGHRLVLELRKTPAWLAWEGANGRKMSQEAFAEFLEDHAPEIVRPTSAEMLEIAQSLQATSKVDFQSGTRLASGQRQLQYVETTAAKAGHKGQLTIPEVFEIGLIPFEGSAAYKVTARFRYRINGSDLTLSYHLDRPEDVLRAAFGDVLEALGAGIEQPILAGSPA